MEESECNMNVVKTLNEFKVILSNHEIATKTKYVVEKSQKKFTDEQLKISTDQKLFWKNYTPYFNVGVRVYACHQGKDKNLNIKKKYALLKNSKSHTDHCYPIKYNNQARVSKKLNCPAVFKVTRVVRMPEFKIGEGCRKKEKDKISKLIKSKVSNSESIGEECYFFKLPNEGQHKFHVLGAATAATEPVDQRVREKIVSLVQRGERNEFVISKLLSSFVENEIQETEPQRRRFYPDLKTVRKIVSTVKFNLRSSSIDQENTELLPCDNEVKDISPTPSTSSPQQFGELKLRGSNKRLLINECSSKMRSIRSILWCLDEEKLKSISVSLNKLFSDFSSEVFTEKSSGLPVEAQSELEATSKADYGNISLNPKKGQTSTYADMLQDAGVVHVEENGTVVGANTAPKPKVSLKRRLTKLQKPLKKKKLKEISNRIDLST